MYISVVIPTLCRDSLIPCLEALRNQVGIQTYEVVVVTHKEFTPEINKYFEEVAPKHWKRAIFNHPGNGPAKNFVVEHCTIGDYIAFTDDDCIPHKRWLVDLRLTQQLSKADIVVGPCYPFNWSNPYQVAHQMHIMYYLETLAGGNSYPRPTSCGTTMNMLISKYRFKALRGFDPIFAQYHGDDRDFNARWASDGYTRAVYAPTASVAHNHPLDLKSFIRLSFKYGVGIQKCRELAIVREDKELPGPPKRREYLKLVNYLLTKAQSTTGVILWAAIMLLVSQEIKRIGMWYSRRHPEYTTK